MHRSALCVQNYMRKAQRKWREYYILKMDVSKYFDSIDKKILMGILQKKIKYLKYEIRNGRMTSKEAHKYLSGHMGYIKIANAKTLTDKLFYKEE